MKRSVLGLDRVVLLLLGLVLVVLGAAAVAWGAGWLTSLWAGAPDQLTLATATDAFAAPWWPTAALVAGAVLGLLALWWVLAHRTHHSVGALRLDGTTPTDPRSIEGSAAAGVAADVVAEARGVRSASGKVVTDRGELVAALSVTVEPGADLEAVATATDAAMADLATVLGRDDVHARVHLSVARTARAEPRAR